MTGVWADRDFRFYWAGFTVSELGSAVSGIAIPLVALFELNASVAEVAALRVLGFLPYLLLTLPAGLVHRTRRRPLMIGCDVVCAVALAAVAVAAALDALTLSLLLAVVFVVGSATAFFDIAAGSLLPSLVGREALLQANATIATSRSASSIVGPGIGGALVSFFKASGAVAVDAASYLVSAACLSRIRAPEPPRTATKAEGIRSLGVGLRQVSRSPVLRPQVVYLAWSGLMFGGIQALTVVFMVRELGLSGLAIGLVTAVGNIGAVLGGLTGRRVAERVGVGHTLVLGAAGTVIGIALLATAPASNPIPWLLASQLAISVSVLWLNIQSITLRQAVTPGQILGRVNAAVRMLGLGAMPIGAIIGGVLGSTVGIRRTLVGLTLLSVVPVIFLALSPLRALRTAPDEEPVWT